MISEEEFSYINIKWHPLPFVVHSTTVFATVGETKKPAKPQERYILAWPLVQPNKPRLPVSAYQLINLLIWLPTTAKHTSFLYKHRTLKATKLFLPQSLQIVYKYLKLCS
jgi:hypothetical protein